MKWILSLLPMVLLLSACGAGGGSAPAKDYDTIGDVASPVGEEVDSYYSSYRELMKSRDIQTESLDTCEPALADQATFADSIAHAVEEGLSARMPQLSYVSGAFHLPPEQANMAQTGLLTHPLCNVTAQTLKDTLGKNVPPAAVIAKAQTFVDRMNAFRRAAYQGDTKALLGAHKLWSRFMMCLSYTESLTTADTRASHAVADKYNFAKPDGVLFYIDRAQKNPASRFNLGLFQFSPDSNGNVQACIRAWNIRYPTCAIDRYAKFGAMVPLLSSPRQVFNAFCGVVKVTDMFGVQVNTSKPGNTHPANRLPGGRTLAASDRCVSPFFRVGASYNHFGPFQNSTKSNLNELLSCAVAE